VIYTLILQKVRAELFVVVSRRISFHRTNCFISRRK